MKFHGRTTEYTKIGVRRKKCPRCGKQATQQWNICANDNRYLPICNDCDIAINRMVLEFMKIPNADELMERYKSQ